MPRYVHCKCQGFSLGFSSVHKVLQGSYNLCKGFTEKCCEENPTKGFPRVLYLVHGHIFRWRHGKLSDVTREIEMTSTQETVHFSFDLQQITE